MAIITSGQKMIDQKPWWLSRTIWGGLFAFLAGLAQEVGIPLSGAEVTALTDSWLNIIGIVGGILAVYGRAKADKRIK